MELETVEEINVSPTVCKAQLVHQKVSYGVHKQSLLKHLTKIYLLPEVETSICRLLRNPDCVVQLFDMSQGLSNPP